MKQKDILVLISVVAATILEILLPFFLDQFLDLKIILPVRLNINIFNLIGILLAIISLVVYFGTRIYLAFKDLKSENNRLREELAKYNNLEIGDFTTDTNRCFLMALTQDLCEPLKIELLNYAAENNHVLAALFLGNIYSSGVKMHDNLVIEKNNEKAFKIYQSIQPYDPYGISDWMMGWLYEKKRIDDAKKLSEHNRLAKARAFYESSAKKDFPKAKNSLGKFYHYGWGGFQKSSTETNAYYKEAAKGRDIYGIMNCGHLEMEQYEHSSNEICYLENAKKYFEDAAKFNNIEGYLQLGIVYEKYKDYEQAKKCFLHSLMGPKNKYSATGYYKLGCLINQNHISKDDQDLVGLFTQEKVADISIECFKKAYEIFQSYTINGLQISGYYYKSCYDNLINSFKKLPDN